MTLEEFKRPYTEAELHEKFAKGGYDPKLWDYCADMNKKWQAYYAEEYSTPDEGETLDDLIAFLKNEEHWNADTSREHTWNEVMNPAKTAAYLEQIAIGHGHLWSMEYADELIPGFGVFLNDVYNRIEEIDNTLAEQEKEIFINWKSKGKPNAYRKFITDLTSSDGYLKPLSKVDKYGDAFLNAYLAQQKNGQSENFCYKFAELTAMHGENIILNSYEAEAYCKGLEKGLSEVDASFYADSVIDGFLNKFRSVNPDEKRLQLAYLYVDFKQDGNNEKDAYILAYKEGYKEEEKEFNRLYDIFRKEGMSDIQAQKEAYKCVSGDDDYFIEKPSSRMSDKDKFEREMLEMMFPNEDIDDEDFNPAEFLDND